MQSVQAQVHQVLPRQVLVHPALQVRLVHPVLRVHQELEPLDHQEIKVPQADQDQQVRLLAAWAQLEQQVFKAHLAQMVPQDQLALLGQGVVVGFLVQ